MELTSDGLLKFYDPTTDDDTKSLKYTLSVQSARILDSLSIRDMHTGLPRGTYGFLIRGRRIATDEILHTPSFEVLPMITREDTNSPNFSTRLKESFVLAEAPEPQPVRDYLCAVDTLEDAQMWVVALQWAAHLRTEDDEHWWKIDYSSPTPKEEEPPKPSPTNTIVTKVTNYKFIRKSTFHWEIAYEIHVLSISVDPDKEETPVTEWTTYKTKDELQHISLDAVKLLQTLPSDGWRDCLSYWNHSALESSVSIVDSVLRSFSLSADAVGDLAKLLNHNTRQRQHDTIESNSIDTYVRKWLSKRRRRPQRSPYYNVMIGGAVAVGLPALRTIWYYSRYMVSCRVDCLVLSWAGAVYIGYRYGSLLQQRAAGQPAAIETTPTITPAPNEHEEDEESEGEAMTDEESSKATTQNRLSSPLPRHSENAKTSCWSQPCHSIFFVRGANYFKDKVKIPSDKAPLECIGVDFWLTENSARHIARHPDMFGGNVPQQDTLVVNFLLPFANFVAYFRIPSLSTFPDKLRSVWTKFLRGDQQYRDARLKLLPVVVEGPWIVKTAVGPGKSPALLGKVIPLQYFFREPTKDRRGMYEIDIIITASSIAKGILSVVKSQTKSVTIAFALIIEAAEQNELPENILCSFQVHSLHLEECPSLRDLNLDEY